MLIVNKAMNFAVNLDNVSMLSVETEEFPYSIHADGVVVDAFSKKEDAVVTFRRIIDAYAANRRVYYIE